MNLSGFPRGLLSLVSAQNRGQALATAADTLSPVLDCRDFYAFDNTLSLQGSGNIAAGSAYNTSLDVPPGQVWRILAGSLVVTAGAGAAAANVGIVHQVGGSGGNSIFLSPSIQLAASTSNFVPLIPPIGFVGPGSRFGCFASGITLAPTYALTLLIERLTA